MNEWIEVNVGKADLTTSVKYVVQQTQCKKIIIKQKKFEVDVTILSNVCNHVENKED